MSGKRYPGLSAYDRDDDASPQARQARNRVNRVSPCAPGTGPDDWPLGLGGVCWCGEPFDHDWPGKADRAPHPRDHEQETR